METLCTNLLQFLKVIKSFLFFLTDVQNSPPFMLVIGFKKIIFCLRKFDEILFKLPFRFLCVLNDRSSDKLLMYHGCLIFTEIICAEVSTGPKITPFYKRAMFVAKQVYHACP